MQILNLDADLNISRLDADIRTLRLGEGGTTNYNELTNKPSINSVVLTGNKTTSDLNIKTSDLVNDEGFITNADIPTKTSDLTNDSGFQTAAQVSSAVAAAIPTNVSAFTNDAGYITAAQVGNIPTKTSDLTNDSGFITSAQAPVQSVNGYTGAVSLDGSNLDYDAGNSINDKIDAVEAAIPTKTSDLTNDSGFITAIGVPSKTSDLINDSGFITSTDIPTDVSAFTNDAGYQTAANVNTLIQAAMPVTETIENESIASFSDGADNVPVSELIVDINAVQDLHGQASPYPAGCGKNKLPLTVSGIKAANTSGTWSGNDYAFRGITYTILTDSDNNVIGIKASGTATGGNANFIINNNIGLSNDNTYILNGCPLGGTPTTYALAVADKDGQWTGENYDIGNGSTLTNGVSNITILITNGTNIGTKTFYPMIRLASETDATFAPYSNICSISGWSECNITDCGKNFADFKDGYTIGFDGYPATQSGHCATVNPIVIKPNTQYKVWASGSGFAFVYSVFNNDTLIRRYASISNGAILDTTGGNKLYVCLYDGVTVSDNKPMVIKATDTTDYAPYQANIYNIDISENPQDPDNPQVVYGGYYESGTGVLTLNKRILTINDFNTLNNNVSAGGLHWSDTDISVPLNSDGLCNTVKVKQSGAWNSQTPILSLHEGSIMPIGIVRLYVLDTTDSDFRANYANIQVCCELSEPIQIQLTPTEVRTLLNCNIFADTGDINKLVYFKTGCEAIARLIEAYT